LSPKVHLKAEKKHHGKETLEEGKEAGTNEASHQSRSRMGEVKARRFPLAGAPVRLQTQ
jgi:hypothetical protein